ncbi:MAG: phage tail tube protein [Candidatus Paceibacterota bacterium]
MSDIIGRQIELGVGVEPTRGTPPGTVERWAKKVKATVVERAQKTVDPSTRNRLEDSLGARVTTKWVEGVFEGVLHADLIGYFLYNLYGAVSSSWVASGVYQHTFSVGQSIQHPSLSLFAKDGSVQQKVYKRCMVRDVKLTAAINDLVRAAVQVIGADSATSAASPSYSTEYDFIARDITLKFAASEGALAAATAIKATDVELTIRQAVQPHHVIGSYVPDDIYNTDHGIDLKFTRAFTDTTFKDLFLADTYQYVQLTIQGAADIGSGNNPTLTLTLNRAQVMDWNRDGEANSVVMEPIVVRAFYNESDGEMSTLVLKNKVAEYDSAPSA